MSSPTEAADRGSSGWRKGEADEVNDIDGDRGGKRGCLCCNGRLSTARGPWRRPVLLQQRGCGLLSVDSPALSPYLHHEAGFHAGPLGSATC